MNAIEEVLVQQQRRAVYVGSDFTAADSLAAFTEIETGTATVGLATGASLVGGAAVFTTAATDDQDCYLYSPEVFTFAAGKSLVAEARCKYTEANTDDANVIFGLMSGVAANHLLAAGAGPAAAYSGAVIYKVDGGTVWRAEGSVNGGATQYGGTSTTTAGGASWQTLRIECHPLTATRMDVSFLIDTNGLSNFVPLRDSNLFPLKYEMDISTVTEMSLVFGARSGSANSEVVLLDSFHAVAIR